jgi:hypothetical protein
MDVGTVLLIIVGAILLIVILALVGGGMAMGGMAMMAGMMDRALDPGCPDRPDWLYAYLRVKKTPGVSKDLASASQERR